MQTSFMHPPFGFALFYLRGIAPKEVKSSDIYWGAVPWVVLQLIMAAIVIVWPQLVTAWLDKPAANLQRDTGDFIQSDPDAPPDAGKEEAAPTDDAAAGYRPRRARRNRPARSGPRTR